MGLLHHPVWSLLLTAYRMITFTCVYTPYSLAFATTKNEIQLVIDILQNFIFLADIIVNFFSAYYDEDYILQDDIKVSSPPFLYASR